MAKPSDRFHTERLLLRRWGAGDAAALKRVLDENVERLKPWIPWAVAAPGTLEEITARIEHWSRDFDDGRNWIWALWGEGGATLLGAIGIYPRDATKRVLIGEADRAEIGYWLTANATGRGYATEAATQVLEVARGLPGITRAEMRCDPANARSIAVPRRLGFREMERFVEGGEATVVWALSL
jgi:RimJ/RimL family protein N-acetyltransferase